MWWDQQRVHFQYAVTRQNHLCLSFFLIMKPTDTLTYVAVIYIYIYSVLTVNRVLKTVWRHLKKRCLSICLLFRCATSALLLPHCFTHIPRSFQERSIAPDYWPIFFQFSLVLKSHLGIYRTMKNILVLFFLAF